MFACVPNPGKQSICRQCFLSARKQSTKQMPNRPVFTHVQAIHGVRIAILGVLSHHLMYEMKSLLAEINRRSLVEFQSNFGQSLAEISRFSRGLRPKRGKSLTKSRWQKEHVSKCQCERRSKQCQIALLLACSPLQIVVVKRFISVQSLGGENM